MCQNGPAAWVFFCAFCTTRHQQGATFFAQDLPAFCDDSLSFFYRFFSGYRCAMLRATRGFSLHLMKTRSLHLAWPVVARSSASTSRLVSVTAAFRIVPTTVPPCTAPAFAVRPESGETVCGERESGVGKEIVRGPFECVTGPHLRPPVRKLPGLDLARSVSVLVRGTLKFLLASMQRRLWDKPNFLGLNLTLNPFL